MANREQTNANFRHMKANRKVTEMFCLNCGTAFEFGEDVVGDLKTGNYYHERCKPAALESASAPALTEAVPAATVPEAAAQAPPPAPALMRAAIVPEVLPPAPSEAKDQTPEASPTAPAAKAPGPGERFCPACAEIIRAAAGKCRFCGTVLDSALKSPDPPGAELPPSIAMRPAPSCTGFWAYLFVCPSSAAWRFQWE